MGLGADYGFGVVGSICEFALVGSVGGADVCVMGSTIATFPNGWGSVGLNGLGFAALVLLGAGISETCVVGMAVVPYEGGVTNGVLLVWFAVSSMLGPSFGSVPTFSVVTA